MRTVTTNTTNQWLSGDYTGPNRPMARATIQKMYINLFDVQSEWGIQNAKANVQKYASAMFGQTHIPMELPNIKSIERNHSVDQDAASCTITLYNTDALPLGVSPDDTAIYDDLGKYTFNRGALNPAAKNRWEDILVPDRIIRTYEGFGFNAAVCPEKDVNLYPTGLWSIDDVRYTTDGLITVQCRDLAKLLIEQIAFPPVVPFEQYPLSFLVRQPNLVQGVIPDKPFFHPNYDTSSTVVGWNINGTYGHKGQFAFDNDKDTYWLSHGHSSPNGRDAFEWIQGTMSGDLQSVQVRVWGGPYRVYLSVYADGKWQGNQNIPYNHEALTWPDVWTGYGSGPDNGAKIKFLQSDTVDRDDTVYFYFKTIMQNVTKIRITFHSLYKSNLGDINHQYRCGVKGIWVSRQAHLGPVQDGSIGNYRYYEQIVELLLCYGGFWWPSSDQDSSYRQVTYSDGTSTTVSAPPNSFYLGKGRVWGDIMTTGAWGQAPLDPTVWDKKPLMDCLAAGTLVATPKGKVPIEQIELGDKVLNATGVGLVTGKRIMKHDRIFVVHVGGERVTCSAGHRFLTTSGWKRADELVSGMQIVSGVGSCSKRMRLVREAISSDTDTAGSSEDMFGHLSSTVGSEDQDEVPSAFLRVVRRGVQTNIVEEQVLLSTLPLRRESVPRRPGVRDVRKGLPSESVHPTRLLDAVPTSPTPGSNARGLVRSAVHVMASIGRRMVSRVLDVTTRDARRSHVDSDRFGITEVPGGYRGRRSFTRDASTEEKRSYPRRVADVHRVDAVEIHRAGTTGWHELFGDEDHVLLYDLSVSGHPSFKVGHAELVVHNCINVVKDILGYNFFVDESGGAIFRLPNVFGVGNYHQGGASDAGYDSNPANLLLIDEAQTLINNGVIVSSRNVREKYFIANLSGQGALSRGYNPYPSGMRRIAIWTDVHFQNAEDCQSMADLLGLRALFTYRMSQLTIVAHPGLQIDDQVKVQDTITGDNYIHRVTSIHSMNDLSTGMWTYDLETHWLGSTPFSDWVFDPANLSSQVKNFINASGLSNVTGQTMI